MLFRRDKQEHRITLIIEFDNVTNYTENCIASVSKYISGIVKPQDMILTDLQAFPKGYRLTYVITFITNNKNKKYVKELSNLSDWLSSNDSYGGKCVSRYHYNYT